MKVAAASVLVLAALAPLMVAHADAATPIGKVLQLLSDLQSKISGEGMASQKAYAEFSEWCEARSKDLSFQIKTSKAEVGDLKATIGQETATISSLGTKVEELAGALATDEADLKAATEIRANEQADFAAEEKELSEVIDTLQRAIGILEKEMRKSGASALQLRNAGSVAQALTVMVQASAFSSTDAARLTALVQSAQRSADAEGELSLAPPAAAVYKGQSGGIIETLEDLLEKAETQMEDARSKETSALHNFEMLKQSIVDEIKFGTKDMAAAKKGLAEGGEKKASAEGDLAVTSKMLSSDTTSLADLHQTCMAKAQDFEAATKSRAEELKALAAAKTAISEETAGAEQLSYGLAQASFLQLERSALSSGTDLANFEAVRFVRDLARKQQSPALAQLASRMASAMRASTGAGADPFAKVKGLISGMITRLSEEAQADSSHKAYCDKELAETNTKDADKSAEIQKLSTKIDQMTARSGQLKEQTAALQKALAELAGSQAEMDKMRTSEHETFVKSKADMQQGLEGVKLALKVLREYYAKDDKAHSAAEGSGSSIIGLLEVVESDFSKGVAEMSSTEESSEASYDQESKENEIEKTTKEQDVAYKTKESVSLDQAVAEAASDRSGVQAELDAALQYLATLKRQCVAVPETYAERKARREAEIAGLKEALSILQGEAVLLQQNARRKLRGTHLQHVLA